VGWASRTPLLAVPSATVAILVIRARGLVVNPFGEPHLERHLGRLGLLLLTLGSLLLLPRVRVGGSGALVRGCWRATEECSFKRKDM
jgi:hypothetical protein